jgi:RimJ/RimL family protein N-acetyltransferase
MLPDLIEAGRFRLRPFRLDEVDTVLEYASDPDFLRYLPIPMPYTRSDAERFLAGQALLDRRQNPSWAIEVDGRASGGLNIRFFENYRIAEIGYGVARRLWGQGFASEAARAVIAAAFHAYPELARVRATADAGNGASIRVMEKLGMTREGLLRQDRPCRGELIDSVVYGLLRREWNG